MITTTTVTSKDGVQFSVSFYSRTDAQAAAAKLAEARFALTRYASELDSFGDYLRVDTVTGYVKLTPRAPALPRIASPAERRASFTVIAGGKS
jgi:hypothetical protein